MKFYLVFLLCITAFSGFSQIDGVYVHDLNTSPKKLHTKTEYEFIPEKDGHKIRLSFFERFDTAGVLLEEKDLNADGTMYAWSFYKYDDRGNIIARTVLNGDSSLMFEQTTTFDSQNRMLHNIGIEPDGNIRFKSVSSYFEDSSYTEVWFDDSSRVGVFESALNIDGMPIRTSYYTRSSEGKILNSKTFKKYQDSTCVEIVKLNYDDKGIFQSGTRKTFSEKGKEIKREKMTLSGNFEPWYEYDYDDHGNKTKEVHFGKKNTLKLWRHTYDDQNRLVKTELNVGPYPFSLAEIKLKESIVIEYKNYYNYSLKITTTKKYSNWLNEQEQITIRSVKFDKDGRWLQVTETNNGLLKEYKLMEYTYH